MSGWRRASPKTQQFPRRPARVAIRISTVDPETDPDTGAPFFRSTEATTANLSRGGAFIHSWEPLAAGRRVIVGLDLPAGGELQLVGRVVWTRRRLEGGDPGSLVTPGYGIEFVERTRSDQAALQQILDATTATAAGSIAASPGPASSSGATASGGPKARSLTGPPA